MKNLSKERFLSEAVKIRFEEITQKIIADFKKAKDSGKGESFINIDKAKRIFEKEF